MPFVSRVYDNRLSDLIVHESTFGQSVGYSRDSINITPPAASAPVLLGTVVFRAKSLDRTAPWTVLASAASIVDTNEFAVVLGDNYNFKRSFIPNAIVSGEYNAVAMRRACILKEYFIKQVHSNLNTTQFELLKGALLAAGILVETTV